MNLDSNNAWALSKHKLSHNDLGSKDMSRGKWWYAVAIYCKQSWYSIQKILISPINTKHYKMFTLQVILAIITSTLLILIVSVQSSKKEGLGGSLGSLDTSQFLSMQQSGDVLEQITWWLMISLFILSLSTAAFIQKKYDLPTSPNLERIQEQYPPSKPDQEA